MKLEVHIDKKYFFILLGAILILAGAIYTNAVENTVSHGWGELGDFPEIGCSADKAISNLNLESEEVSCSSLGDIMGISAGNGIIAAENSGSVTLSADTTYLQKRVSTDCGAGKSIRKINSNGGVTCETDDVGGTPTQYQSCSSTNCNFNFAPSSVLVQFWDVDYFDDILILQGETIVVGGWYSDTISLSGQTLTTVGDYGEKRLIAYG